MGVLDLQGGTARAIKACELVLQVQFAVEVEHGVEVGRFEAWGCGEAHPIADNRRRRGRQQNRRVEFHIIDPPTAGYTPREGCVRAEAEAPAAE